MLLFGLCMHERGSPPQVRGKLFERYILGNWVRITPAGAGKTERLILDAEALEDHPRRCGENAVRQPFKYLMIGSPPQVRGKLFARKGVDKSGRITPAGAGKTYRLS